MFYLPHGFLLREFVGAIRVSSSLWTCCAHLEIFARYKSEQMAATDWKSRKYPELHM